MRQKRNLRDVHVKVCIPSGGLWEPKFCMSLLGLIGGFDRFPVDWIRTLRVSTNVVSGSMLAHNRETLFRNALKDRADYMLWLDTDMVFPKDTLSHLLRHRKSFVAAQGVTKDEPAQPCAQMEDGGRLYTGPMQQGLDQVAHVGLACALIETNVAARMSIPRFDMPFMEDVDAHMGEDVFFCKKWTEEVQEPIWVDRGLSWQLGHAGTKLYSMADALPAAGHEPFAVYRSAS